MMIVRWFSVVNYATPLQLTFIFNVDTTPLFSSVLRRLPSATRRTGPLCAGGTFGAGVVAFVRIAQPAAYPLLIIHELTLAAQII